MTVVSWLEVKRDVERFKEAKSAKEQLALLGSLVGRVVYGEAKIKKIRPQAQVELLDAFFTALAAEDKPNRSQGEETKEPDYGHAAAKLAAVYGGGMWHWLNEAPLPVFNAGLARMQALGALETLREATAAALGGGKMKKFDADSLRSELERQAKGLEQVSVAAPQTKEELLAQFAIMGVPVEVM